MNPNYGPGCGTVSRSVDAPPTRDTIGAAISRQGESLDILSRVLSDLEQRLASILAPSEGVGSVPKVAAERETFFMRHAVNTNTERIDAIRLRLNTLLEQIEL